MSLCSSVEYFRDLARESGFNQVTVPIFFGGLTAVMGGYLLFPMFERNLLPNHAQSANMPTVLDNLHRKPGFLFPFFCAFVFNTYLTYKNQLDITYDQAQMIMICAFVALPIILWLSSLKSQTKTTKKQKKE
jgi:hypothetical protein